MGKKIIWDSQATKALRSIDQQTALRILHALGRFLKTGHGDVIKLQNIDPPELRLRVGDYRLFFEETPESVNIHAVSHRRESYR